MIFFFSGDRWAAPWGLENEEELARAQTGRLFASVIFDCDCVFVIYERECDLTLTECLVANVCECLCVHAPVFEHVSGYKTLTVSLVVFGCDFQPCWILSGFRVHEQVPHTSNSVRVFFSLFSFLHNPFKTDVAFVQMFVYQLIADRNFFFLAAFL